ncbi:hypothetical protein TIFTF001_042639 [Ficus carica]|uniref:Uncharacterized protein n=1 Tax=Ficus carica TaxID=3494 RepID=A0AA88AC31_FICCA|nr:hypothetical protein TIFTF001_042639 [Ficus carica]
MARSTMVQSGTTLDPTTGKAIHGKERMVFDYRKLNQNTHKDQYILPGINTLLKKLKTILSFPLTSFPVFGSIVVPELTSIAVVLWRLLLGRITPNSSSATQEYKEALEATTSLGEPSKGFIRISEDSKSNSNLIRQHNVIIEEQNSEVVLVWLVYLLLLGIPSGFRCGT